PMSDAPFQRLGERDGVSWSDDQTVFAVANEVGGTSACGGNHWQSVGKGFGHHHPKAVTQGRKYEHVRVVVALEQLGARNARKKSNRCRKIAHQPFREENRPINIKSRRFFSCEIAPG